MREANSDIFSFVTLITVNIIRSCSLLPEMTRLVWTKQAIDIVCDPTISNANLRLACVYGLLGLDQMGQTVYLFFCGLFGQDQMGHYFTIQN